MSTVFFLGAGFSRPFGQPVMNEFMSYARQHLENDDRLFLADLALDARRANSILNSSPTNLEDVLSFAVMSDRVGLYDERNEPRSPRLRRILSRMYSRIDPDELRGFWGRYELFKDLRHMFELPGPLSIITTNYDINVESALAHMGEIAELPFSYESYRSTTNVIERYRLSCRPLRQGHTAVGRPRVRLYKLHGSVNWFNSDGGTLVVQDDVVAPDPPRSVPIPRCLYDNYDPPGEPIIVPPSFLKPEMQEPLLSVWQGAGKELSQAVRIVFVGYSFPLTDVEMRFFFASSVAGNRWLEQIIIIDPNADQIVARLSRPDSGYGTHFVGMLHSFPVENGWTRAMRSDWIFR